jgi:hypothetical protein
VDKLVALMLSSGITKKNKKKDEVEEQSITSRILNKILTVRTVIFDEAHWMQSVMPASYTIASKRDDKLEYTNIIAKYKPILDDFDISLVTAIKYGRKEEVFVEYIPIFDEYLSNEMMAKVVLNFAALIVHEPIVEARESLIEEANKPGYHEKHFGKLRRNPQYTYLTKKDMASCVSRICNEAINMIVDGKHKLKYHLDVVDINDLFDIASVVTAEMIQIDAVRNDKNFNIKVSVANRIKLGMIACFVNLFKKLGDKKIILTSATFGSFNYDSILPKGEKFEKIMFGEDGDPLNTNNKMLLLADTKRLSFTKGKYSALQQMQEITKNIADILNEFGDCFIIAPNKMLADLFKKSLTSDGYNVDVTYYNSIKTIGVKSHCRVAAVICLAEIPSDSYKIIATNPDESFIMRQESVDIATAQAINRVKDPDGLKPSVVFMFGVTEDQANNIATWGIDRKTSVHRVQGNRKKVEVTCSSYIAKPKVTKCDDFAIALSTAIKHMSSNKSPENTPFDQQNNNGQKPILPHSQASKIKIENNISTVKSQSYIPTDTRNNNNNISIGSCDCTRVSHVEFINLILKHGPWGDRDFKPLSESKVKKHLSSREILKTQIVSKEGKVSWIIFRDIKFMRDVDRVIEYLNSFNCPYVIEQDTKEQTFSVWIFIKPIEAKKAKKFGEYIIKYVEKTNGQKFHCELIPKYTHHKGAKFKENNEMKLPLHPNSKILVCDEFVSTFESLEIGILDIKGHVAKIEAYEAVAAEGKKVAEGVKEDTELNKLVEEHSSFFDDTDF